MLPRLMAILLGIFLLLPTAGFAVIHDISITGFQFVPGHQTITQGDTVRWTNNDGGIPHTSTSDAGLWNSGTLTNGQSFSRAFTSTGSFPYHCNIHTTMHDTLTVVPAQTFDVQVNIVEFSFNPAVIQINPGQTVRWMNNGGHSHTSTSNDGFWDSDTLAPGAHFDHVFPTEGVFHYHCAFHPSLMKGTVIVGKPDSVAFDLQIIDFAFVPAETSITMGQNIRWINFGSMEHTTSDTSANLWDSGILNPGDVFTLHAGQAGTFHYLCNFHPTIMTGTLIIADTVTTPSCAYVVGDINGNGTANGIDVVYGVSYFKGGAVPPVACNCSPIPFPFYAAGDVNANCVFNGIDITYFVSYLKGTQPALHFCPTCAPTSMLPLSASTKETIRSANIKR